MASNSCWDISVWAKLVDQHYPLALLASLKPRILWRTTLGRLRAAVSSCFLSSNTPHPPISGLLTFEWQAAQGCWSFLFDSSHLTSGESSVGWQAECGHQLEVWQKCWMKWDPGARESWSSCDTLPWCCEVSYSMCCWARLAHCGQQSNTHRHFCYLFFHFLQVYRQKLKWLQSFDFSLKEEHHLFVSYTTVPFWLLCFYWHKVKISFARLLWLL